MSDIPMVDHAQTLKNTLDTTIGMGGITSPFWYKWLHSANELAAFITIIGGAILILLRIALAIREWRRG